MRWIFGFCVLLLLSCSGSGSENEIPEYTPVPVNVEIPQLFQENLIAPVIPIDNPLTEEGIALGKKLFFDRLEDIPNIYLYLVFIVVGGNYGISVTNLIKNTKK